MTLILEQNIRKVFKCGRGWLPDFHFCCYEAKRPNLKLKTWPIQQLISLLLKIGLIDATCSNFYFTPLKLKWGQLKWSYLIVTFRNWGTNLNIFSDFLTNCDTITFKLWMLLSKAISYNVGVFYLIGHHNGMYEDLLYY